MLAKETEKQQELTGRDQWIVFKRLLKYLAPHKKMLALAMGLLVLTVLGDVLGPLIIKIFIDDYLTPRTFPTGPIVGLAAAYLFIQASNVIITYFQMLKFQVAALKIIQQLR